MQSRLLYLCKVDYSIILQMRLLYLCKLCNRPEAFYEHSTNKYVGHVELYIELDRGILHRGDIRGVGSEETELKLIGQSIN